MMQAVPYKLEQGIFVAEFHIFELEWDADSLTWSVDGEKHASTPITSDELSEFHK